MQALRVHAFDQPPRLDSLHSPEPAAGEVRVRVQACGISFFDLLIARGAYQWKPPLPFTVGSEFAGTVDALGAGATGFAIGDRVCGSLSIGGWADQVCVSASALQHVAPQAAIDEAAVLHTPYGTALYALRERGQLQAGETVLVLGATGSIGDAGVQTAKALGARVIAAASGPAKQSTARLAGADEVVDVQSADWKDTVKALAGPRGVDVVLDPVGGEAMDTAFRTLGWGGRHLVVGFAGGSIGSLKANLCIVKGASLIGVDLRQYRERQPEAMNRLLADVTALHGQGRIRPRIAAHFPLTQAAEAFAMAGARTTTGRVILDF
ncbi:NADPH:quinone oxidoreductase family protein [Pseudorhodoferax sp.]|uniref:NADPH:quinone oxidoreductase family protein n=1 Tax=Pseudorhodoferax sp. TaxID=1993553 RepID=UPI002DD686D1|nr:NADPH:quinone oxidoreductase family protein [Pseudorhodoferax sp.]